MENKKSKVSIGMPVWNGEDFIKLALDSLLAQDFKDFEIIISDNASTDNTEEICEKYIKKDERIKYIRQCENIGLDRNFNFVLDKAKGEYFMWAAHDDLWEPTYISEMVKVLDNNKSVVIASGITEYIDRNGSSIRTLHEAVPLYSPRTIFKRAFKLLIEDLHHTQAGIIFYGLMRTHIIKKIGGYSHFKKNRVELFNRGTYTGDIQTIFKLIFEGDFYIVNKVLFYQRESMVRHSDVYLKSYKKLDILFYILSTVLKNFFDVHRYYATLRRILSGSDITFYQKYFLFCVAWIEEFIFYIRGLFHYFISFIRVICSKTYRNTYHNRLSKFSIKDKGVLTKDR